MSNGELACTYAALILHDEEIPITAERISKLIKAANVKSVESYWPSVFAKFLEKKNIEDLILSVSASTSVAASAPVAVNAAVGGVAPVDTPAVEEKEEVKEESDEEGLFSLFD